MKKLLLTIVFNLIILFISYSQNRVQIIKDIDWSENGFPFKKDYGVDIGVDCFYKSSNTFSFYSNLDSKIYNVSSDENISKVNSLFENNILDFILNNDLYYVLYKNKVNIYNQNGKLLNTIIPEQRIIAPQRIKLVNNKIYIIDFQNKTTLVADNDNVIKNLSYSGTIVSENIFIESKKISDKKILLNSYNSNDIIDSKIYNTSDKLGTVQVIGIVDTGILLDVEYIINDLPLLVKRKFTKINFKNGTLGDIAFEVEVPNTYKIKMQKDYYLENNILFYLICTKEKAMLSSIDFSNNQFTESCFPKSLLYKQYHYNDNLIKITDFENAEEVFLQNKALMYRSQMLEIAETFETHLWICNSNNIRNYDCGGVNVTTPSWVQIGINRSIPYMWGGFSSLTQYDQGLINGVSAGDKTTVGGGAGSSCAVGVDCSGFVSRAWGQTSKYGTSTLPSISTAYTSFTQLKPGDIVNLAGSHVRLVHTVNTNGTFTMLEATAANNAWAVVYNTYTVSALQGASYIPRYFNQVVEDILYPPTLISPLHIAVNVNVPVIFDWSSIQNANNYRIQVSTSSSSWTPENGFTSNSNPNSVVVVNATTDSVSKFEWNYQSIGTYTSALPNTKYYWTVRVYVPSLGTSVFTNPREFISVNDIVAPTTSISVGDWQTENFNVDFFDNDNFQVSQRFYSVSDLNVDNWSANNNYGFLFDEFNNQINQNWTSLIGTWSILNSALNQSVENNSNTNLYTLLNQGSSNLYLYEWRMKINGTGTNKRAGIYIFASDATLTQRGNSYMIYFREDDNKCQIYKSVNNSISLQTDNIVNIEVDTWYNYKVKYNPQTGLIEAYVNDILASSWIDSSPLLAGNSLSLRTGDCNVSYDDFVVYKSRGISQSISIGDNNEIRFQNSAPNIPSSKIISIVNDYGSNFSARTVKKINIDWTNPSSLSYLNDGIGSDIDTTNETNNLFANWDESFDFNSGIHKYQYCIGTYAGANNIVDWTDLGINTTIDVINLNLVYDSMYYFSVKSINNAGLYSEIISSDGILVLNNTIINNELNYSILTVFPNPVSNYLNILNNNSFNNIQVVDIVGNVLIDKEIFSGLNRINISELKNGIYLIICYNNSNKNVFKIIKN